MLLKSNNKSSSKYPKPDGRKSHRNPPPPPHPHRNEGGSDKGRMEGREVDERSFKEEKTLNEKKCAAAAG